MSRPLRGRLIRVHTSSKLAAWRHFLAKAPLAWVCRAVNFHAPHRGNDYLQSVVNRMLVDVGNLVRDLCGMTFGPGIDRLNDRIDDDSTVPVRAWCLTCSPPPTQRRHAEHRREMGARALIER